MKTIVPNVEFDDFLPYVDSQQLGKHASYFLPIDVVCCYYLTKLYVSLGSSVLLDFRNSINSGHSGMGPSAGVWTSTLAFAAVVLTSLPTLLALALVIVYCLWHRQNISFLCLSFLFGYCNTLRNKPLILSTNVSFLGVQCRLFILVEITLAATLIGIFICKCMAILLWFWFVTNVARCIRTGVFKKCLYLQSKL